jgi:hypothetical protein
MFSPPDGTTITDVRTENTDVREVGFHPPRFKVIVLFPNQKCRESNLVFYLVHDQVGETGHSGRSPGELRQQSQQPEEVHREVGLLDTVKNHSGDLLRQLGIVPDQ